jgi:hypothetical protein
MMNDKRRKAAYEEYVAWFNALKESQEGIQSLIDGKRFNGYYKVEKDKDGRYDPKDVVADTWGMFCFNTADPEVLIAKATLAKARNKMKIDEAFKHVGANPGAPLLNPEFIARAEATKKLREEAKKFGGNEGGNEYVLAIKKQAEAEGKDFTAVALQKVQEIRGEEKPETIQDAVFTEIKQPNRAWSGIRWFVNRASGGLLCKKVGEL